MLISLEPEKAGTETLWCALQLKSNLWKMVSPHRRKRDCCS